MPKKTIRIGVTIGDPAGIGPEVVLKSLVELSFLRNVSLHCYTYPEILLDCSKSLGINSKKISHILTSCINLSSKSLKDLPKPGKPDKQSALIALDSFRFVIRDIKGKKLDAIVTAPINKKNISLIRNGFNGHTGYLSKSFRSETAMMLTANDFRVVLVTEHIALSEVARYITKDTIINKTLITINSLKRQFGIPNPRIGVLGLNPHLGDDGLYGDEDKRIIQPAVAALQKRGYNVRGPLPPDTAFLRTRFDAYIVQYHDQGLILQKYIADGCGVNITLGLPFIRTSPDHGTAFDIAHRFCADHRAMSQAIKTAIQLSRLK